KGWPAVLSPSPAGLTRGSIIFVKTFAKEMDCRVISAFTRVFDALCPAMTSGGGEQTASTAPSKRSPAVEQEAVVLEPHAGDLARAHGAQEMRERDGGVGVGETLGADVGDAVALRVGRLRRGLEGEISAHAVGRG